MGIQAFYPAQKFLLVVRKLVCNPLRLIHKTANFNCKATNDYLAKQNLNMLPNKLETETYAILSNLDWTITKLNPIIKNDGYEFVAITLQNLELNFSEVFNISRVFKPKQHIVKSFESEGVNVISEEFEGALKYYFALHPGSEDNPPDHEVYLLKRVKNSLTERGNTYFLIGESASAQIEISNFVNGLIRKLRLFKKGQIEFQGYFSILTKDRKVISKYKTPKKPLWGVYQIEDSDIPSLEKLLSEDLQIPTLLKLAIESFELAYDATDPKVKFVLLMSGLESIFNRSSQDPVKHIISRHLALTLANSKEEFEKLFATTKKLYDTRCNIIHGNTDKKVIEKLQSRISVELQQLEELIRRVVNKLLWLHDFDIGEPTKDALFEYLNKKGYEG